ncbi:hypothetical protein CDEST_06980 [Colletotrichum destructivum]|uniref:Uncharacterized protein n=1 Tax=Colletotrichum destructivum TaxID=34406 RepID=A0AAX4IF23_9PEZI|nr:hypothetical protein CDEST_06980 [Colletotrichum destructivum]
MYFSTLIGVIVIAAGLASASPVSQFNPSIVERQNWQSCPVNGQRCTNINGGVGGCVCRPEVRQLAPYDSRAALQSSKVSMVSTTTYEPLLATLTFTPGGFQQTKVLSLEPQTTPFTPPDGACSADIRCQYKPEELSSGAECLGDQVVVETKATLPTQCFPKSYNEIWRPSGTFSDVASMAYPGTACISGWTTACTTTLTLESAQTYVQTWCCPPGSYTCLTPGPGETPWRDCVSMLSTNTEVWVNNSATSGGGEKVLWSSWRKVSLTNLPSSGPLSVKHPVFPLYGQPAPRGIDGAEGGLSTGAVAGIAAGAVALVFVLLGGGICIIFRKRRQKRAVLAARNLAANDNDGRDYNGLGYDTKQELPGHGLETRALKVATPPPVELAA